MTSLIEPLTALALVLLSAVGSKMHSRCVIPEKERLPFFVGLVNEVEGKIGHLVIDGFHALPGEGTRVLNLKIFEISLNILLPLRLGRSKVGVDKSNWFPLPFIPSHAGEGSFY